MFSSVHRGQRCVGHVIIPVYNALAQTSRCIESVLKHSTHPYRLVIVNDCSDWATSSYLREVAEVNDQVVLLENEKNKGFLGTANRGLSYEEGDYRPLFKLILNSDTLVSEGWLEAFERCFRSDEKIGLATAVSNNAENISISMPEGYNAHTMAVLALKHGAVLGYPDVTTAVGFCMAIRAQLLETIGLFDEVFAPGYGEESDYHFKVLCKGYRSVVVSDCFVYHESHASFSKNKEVLIRRNRPIFDSRWKIIYHNEFSEQVANGNVTELKTVSEVGVRHKRKHDVLFIIPTSKIFGGIVVVYEVCRRLIERGLDANAIVLTSPEQLPSDLPFVPYFRPDIKWMSRDIPASHVYVATHYETSPYAFMAHLYHPNSKLAYLVQGYEAWFPGASIGEVIHTLRAIPHRVVVSEWLRTMLRRWDLDATVIPNGVDLRFFYPQTADPAARSSGDPITLFTLLREDPQGGTTLAARVLADVKKRVRNLYVIAVGNLSAAGPFASVVDECFVSASRAEMRNIYRRSDIFADFSIVQGFGLMGLEAMATGVATVLSATGGAEEYATPANSVLVKLGDEKGFIDAIDMLARNPDRVAKLKRAGYETAQHFGWTETIERYADYFEMLLKAEAGGGMEDHREHMMQYLFGRLISVHLTANVIATAEDHLKGGFECATPAGAFEILGGVLPADQLERVQTTREGMALVRIYESARGAITRARHCMCGSQGGTTGLDSNLVIRMERILSKD